MGTKIQWTDEKWNPVTGCDPISEGCEHCYAKRFALSRLKNNPKYSNGFKVTCHEKELQTPYRWRKPRKVFVCSMADLFHEDVPYEFIDKIFETMIDLDKFTFQILTKRPHPMVRWYDASRTAYFPDNVWAGVSVETQFYLSRRLCGLKKVLAKTNFVSLEPLLGPIDLQEKGWLQFLDWVIVGGETGYGARPMKPEWAMDIRDQCVAAGVPFFFKRMSGEVAWENPYLLDGREWKEFPRR